MRYIIGDKVICIKAPIDDKFLLGKIGVVSNDRINGNFILCTWDTHKGGWWVDKNCLELYNEPPLPDGIFRCLKCPSTTSSKDKLCCDCK